MELAVIKQRLYQQSVAYVDQRINNSLLAIKNAQESANSEVKSSAGDKHETGRAMAQLETEKNGIQLAEANKLKQAIGLINPAKTCEKVELGALVITNVGNYFLAVSIGKMEVENTLYFGVSPVSPIGQALLNHKQGDEVLFNGRNFSIEAIV
ncbi:MAG: GreA/GreB family elongation factor [Flavobacteriales bacterium]|jgi:transcription elongation GreA/GreB family factor|nr:GreA/GreB family elongation factor [Flavobacteriales bacterium]